MMMMVLCGQRVQAVHDHGGRRVGMTRRGTAYQKRIRCFCSASFIFGTVRREGVNDRVRASQKHTTRIFSRESRSRTF